MPIVGFNFERILAEKKSPVNKELRIKPNVLIKEVKIEEVNLTLRNKGLFNVDGYILRINNETDFAGDPKGIPFILVEIVDLNTSLG